MEQRCTGTLQIWAEPFVPLRVPKLFNLRTDPYERADITSNRYWEWLIENAYLVMAGTNVIGDFLQTFAEFPPRQKAATFTIDQALEKMSEALTSGQ
jgi:arylsulfatase